MSPTGADSHRRLQAAALALCGEAVRSARALHGGDLSEVTLLVLASGRRVVGKTGPHVAAEARMLRAMRDAGAPAPEVLGLAGDVLLIEAIEETGPSAAGWRALGAGLRKLHTATGPHYGWSEDYAFGPVGITNRPLADWPSFWATRRLLTGLDALPAELPRRLETLATRLPDLLPRHPPPALLHGDLWRGNVLFGPGGRACLIDPACYFGHAEVDLAMLHLFGTPDTGFAAAYGPPEPGWQDRRALYQLWPALVHLRLFGSGYRAMVEQRLTLLGL